MKQKPLVSFLLAAALFAAGHVVFYFSFVTQWIFADHENGDYTLRDDAADVIGFAIDVPAMREFGRQ